VNLASKIYHTTALHLAADNGNPAIVQKLLTAGVTPATLNRIEAGINFTALMMAAAKGHLEVVKLLVNAGANINQINGDGETALRVAEAPEEEGVVKPDKEAIIKFLKEQGAK